MPQGGNVFFTPPEFTGLVGLGNAAREIGDARSRKKQEEEDKRRFEENIALEKQRLEQQQTFQDRQLKMQELDSFVTTAQLVGMRPAQIVTGIQGMGIDDFVPGDTADSIFMDQFRDSRDLIERSKAGEEIDQNDLAFAFQFRDQFFLSDALAGPRSRMMESQTEGFDLENEAQTIANERFAAEDSDARDAGFNSAAHATFAKIKQDIAESKSRQGLMGAQAAAEGQAANAAMREDFLKGTEEYSLSLTNISGVETPIVQQWMLDHNSVPSGQKAAIEQAAALLREQELVVLEEELAANPEAQLLKQGYEASLEMLGNVPQDSESFDELALATQALGRTYVNTLLGGEVLELEDIRGWFGTPKERGRLGLTRDPLSGDIALPSIIRTMLLPEEGLEVGPEGVVTDTVISNQLDQMVDTIGIEDTNAALLDLIDDPRVTEEDREILTRMHDSIYTHAENQFTQWVDVDPSVLAAEAPPEIQEVFALAKEAGVPIANTLMETLGNIAKKIGNPSGGEAKKSGEFAAMAAGLGETKRERNARVSEVKAEREAQAVIEGRTEDIPAHELRRRRVERLKQIADSLGVPYSEVLHRGSR